MIMNTIPRIVIENEEREEVYQQITDQEAIRQYEEYVITRRYLKCRGNLSKTARKTEMARNTLREKLKLWGLRDADGHTQKFLDMNNRKFHS